MGTTTSDDLKSLEALCEDAADAAFDLLVGLGPRPADPSAATAWDTQDALLKNKISTLNNFASSIGATIVVQALDDVWPQLNGLKDVAAEAESKIAKIAEINKTMSAIASVINFATAAVTVITQPSVGTANKLASAFGQVKAQLA
jgi:hypothetical protein